MVNERPRSKTRLLMENNQSKELDLSKIKKKIKARKSRRSSISQKYDYEVAKKTEENKEVGNKLETQEGVGKNKLSSPATLSLNNSENEIYVD